MSHTQKKTVNWEFTPYPDRDKVSPLYAPVCLRVASLPRQYRTEQNVIDLIEEYLFLGKVCNVKISSHVAQNGTVFYSAVVELNSWNYTDNVSALLAHCKSSPNSTDYDFDQRVNIAFGDRGWFHMNWDNGKPMEHLTVHLVAQGSSIAFPKDSLKLVKTEWTSLHIPVLPEGLGIRQANGDIEYITEHNLKSFIEGKLRLGKIRRIDYIRREQDDAALPGKAVFIHFDEWHDTKNAKYLRSKLNEAGFFRQKGYFDGSEMRPFEIYDPEIDGMKPAYFVFKINHRPIPEVDENELNVHQLAALVAKLSLENADLVFKNTKLVAENTELKSNVEAPMNAV